jgi:hypothetical protein
VVVADQFVNTRFSAALLDRLDELAAARGLSRSEVIRGLVMEAAPDRVVTIPTADEAMALIAEKARAGNLPALKAVLAYHAAQGKTGGEPADTDDEALMAALEAAAQ